jgi:hypothetical protein
MGTVKDGPENLLRDEDEIDPEDLSICPGGGHTLIRRHPVIEHCILSHCVQSSPKERF